MSDYPQADIKDLEKEVLLNPDNAGAWDDLGINHFENENFDQALVAYEKAVTLDRTDPHKWVRLAVCYAKLGNHDRAYETFQSAIDLDSTDAAIWSNLGWTYSMHDNPSQALEAYKMATKLDPSRSFDWLMLGYAYALTGDYIQGAQSWQQAIDQSPEKAPALVYGVIAYRRLGDLKERTETWREVIDRDPDNALLHAHLGATLYFLRKSSEAIAPLHQAVKLDDSLAWAWFFLGEAYMGQVALISDRPKQKAVDAYRNAVSLCPKMHQLHRNLGKAHYELGQHQEAVDALMQATEINPDDAVAWRTLGYSYYELDDPMQAAETLRKAVELDPNDAVAWRTLGHSCGKLGNHQEEIQFLERASAIDADNSDFSPDFISELRNIGLGRAVIGNTFRKGMSHFKLNDWEQAAEAFRQVIKLDPNHLEAHNNLGVTYLNQDHSERAKLCWQQTVQIAQKVVGTGSGSEDAARAWRLMGQAYDLLGERDQAVKAFEKEAALNPSVDS